MHAHFEPCLRSLNSLVKLLSLSSLKLRKPLVSTRSLSARDSRLILTVDIPPMRLFLATIACRAGYSSYYCLEILGIGSLIEAQIPASWRYCARRSVVITEHSLFSRSHARARSSYLKSWDVHVPSLMYRAVHWKICMGSPSIA